jgi:hypothetical protein
MKYRPEGAQFDLVILLVTNVLPLLELVKVPMGLYFGNKKSF